MKNMAVIGMAGLALAAFQALAAADTDDAAAIMPAPAAAVADQLIECTTEQAPGITTTEFFLVKDGKVKRYARSMNMARDMCMPGQPDCALGWRGGKIAMAFATPDGTRHAAEIDLAARSIAKTETSPNGAAQTMAGTCSSGPIPAGAKID